MSGRLLVMNMCFIYAAPMQGAKIEWQRRSVLFTLSTTGCRIVQPGGERTTENKLSTFCNGQMVRLLMPLLYPMTETE